MTEKSVDSNRLFHGRPNRTHSIERDEVISLKIDLEVLDVQDLYEKYFVVVEE